MPRTREIRKKQYHKSVVPLSTREPNAEQGAWIGYQLKLNGITQRDMAEIAGVSQQMVQRVAYGLSTSARVQKAIAKALLYGSWQELTGARQGVAA